MRWELKSSGNERSCQTTLARTERGREPREHEGLPMRGAARFPRDGWKPGTEAASWASGAGREEWEEGKAGSWQQLAFHTSAGGRMKCEEVEDQGGFADHTGEVPQLGWEEGVGWSWCDKVVCTVMNIQGACWLRLSHRATQYTLNGHLLCNRSCASHTQNCDGHSRQGACP